MTSVRFSDILKFASGSLLPGLILIILRWRDGAQELLRSRQRQLEHNRERAQTFARVRYWHANK